MELPTLAPTIENITASQKWSPPALNSLAQQSDAETRQTAEEFEGFFIGYMLQSMWQGIDTKGMFGGGQAEQTFRGLLNEEYGKAIAKNGGFGIADLVYREILRIQEASNAKDA